MFIGYAYEAMISASGRKQASVMVDPSSRQPRIFYTLGILTFFLHNNMLFRM